MEEGNILMGIFNWVINMFLFSLDEHVVHYFISNTIFVLLAENYLILENQLNYIIS